MVKLVELDCVFPVAITYGKPCNTEFLNDSINEFNNLINDSIIFNEKMVKVKLSAIVCDAPAKSFVKQIVQFNGYNGCNKCLQHGVRIVLDGEKSDLITYPLITYLR